MSARFDWSARGCSRPAGGAARTMLSSALLLGLCDLMGVAGTSEARAGQAPKSGYGQVVNVQVVSRRFSVVDGKTKHGVHGLTPSDLKVFVDGHRLTSSLPSGFSVQEQTISFESPLDLNVLIDLSFLDMKSRAAAADEVERLSERAPGGASRFKFYALLDELVPMNRAFTRDRKEIERVAQMIRDSSVGLGATTTRSDLARNTRTNALLDYVNFRQAVTDGDLGCVFASNWRSMIEAAEATDDESGVRTSSLGPFERAVKSPVGMAASSAEDEHRRVIGALSQLETALNVGASRSKNPVFLLLTSGSLDLPRDERLESRTASLYTALEQGSQLSVADVDAPWRKAPANSSHLLVGLSKASGGDYFRGIDGVFEQLLDKSSSLYVLEWRTDNTDSSKPVELDISIDTQKRPDLWGATIVAPQRVRVISDKDLNLAQRTAALSIPADFVDIPVDVDVRYPSRRAESSEYPVHVRVPLSALNWVDTESNTREARFSVDLVVGQGSGFDSPARCDLAESGHSFSLRLPKDQAIDTLQSFELVANCRGPHFGTVTARAVVVDENKGTIAAGQGTTIVMEPQAQASRVQVARVFASSGEDFGYRSGLSKPQLDEKRDLGRMVNNGEPIRTDEQIRVEYLLCDPAARDASVQMAYRVVRTGDNESRSVMALTGQLQPAGAPPRKGRAACSGQEVRIDDFALEPGHYALEIGPDFRAGEPRPDGRPMAVVPFEIVAN